MEDKTDESLIRWRLHYGNLRKEIIDCNNQNWIFRQPLNVLTQKLTHFAKRAAQTKDPIMLDIACSLALYEFSDPTSPHYNEKAVKEIRLEAIKKATGEK